MSVKIISKVDELFPTLYEIGSRKNMLPMELRGWVNVLELYVQLRHVDLLTSSIESLVAGGKYVGYFSATCDYPLDRSGTETMVNTMFFSDFSKWKIKKFDQKVWERRFAHLVEPTSEIAWSLANLDKKDPLIIPRLVSSVKIFKSTGEWFGLQGYKCVSCGEAVSWWTHIHCEPCPHCLGKVRA